MLVILSAASFACVDGISKLLAETQPVAQIVWARYALALPPLFLMTGPGRWPSLYRTGQMRWQLLRGMTPLAISVSMVLGVHFLPLAEATVILFTSPFLVVALAGTMLGEPVRLVSWVGVVVGFVAVLVVTRPGFGHLSVYAFFPLIAAVFGALMQLLTRRLGAAGELADTTLAWTLTVGATAVTPVAFATWPETSLHAWVLLVSLGTVFGLGQFLMIRAFTLASAGVLAPISYIQIVAAVVFGAIVFGDLPDLWSFVGIAMIFFAGLLVVRRS